MKDGSKLCSSDFEKTKVRIKNIRITIGEKIHIEDSQSYSFSFFTN